MAPQNPKSPPALAVICETSSDRDNPDTLLNPSTPVTTIDLSSNSNTAPSYSPKPKSATPDNILQPNSPSLAINPQSPLLNKNIHPGGTSVDNKKETYCSENDDAVEPFYVTAINSAPNLPPSDNLHINYSSLENVFQANGSSFYGSNSTGSGLPCPKSVPRAKEGRSDCPVLNASGCNSEHSLLCSNSNPFNNHHQFSSSYMNNNMKTEPVCYHSSCSNCSDSEKSEMNCCKDLSSSLKRTKSDIVLQSAISRNIRQEEARQLPVNLQEIQVADKNSYEPLGTTSQSDIYILRERQRGDALPRFSQTNSFDPEHFLSNSSATTRISSPEHLLSSSTNKSLSNLESNTSTSPIRSSGVTPVNLKCNINSQSSESISKPSESAIS